MPSSVISSVSREAGTPYSREQLGDGRREGRVDQGTGGEVHRDRQRPAGVQPAAGAAQALAQHDLGEPAELPGVLGDRDEVGRRDLPVRRVLPPGQALDADHAPVGQRHLGLEVDLDLGRLQRPPHVGGEAEPMRRARPAGSGWKRCTGVANCLAAWAARSARLSRTSASVPWSGCTATPTATSTSSVIESTSIGSCSASRSRAASATASSASGRRSVTTNSSLPTRPTSAAAGASRRSRVATSTTIRSPASWPSESLTSRRPSMSKQQDRDHLARGPDLDRLLEQGEDPAAVRQPGERVVVGVEPQPVDQAGVLHRHGRVRGERLQQPYVGLAELRACRRAGRSTSSVPITAEPERSGTTIASLTPLPRITARSSESPDLGPDDDGRLRAMARSRSTGGVLLTSSRPGASTRALSSNSG